MIEDGEEDDTTPEYLRVLAEAEQRQRDAELHANAMREAMKHAPSPLDAPRDQRRYFRSVAPEERGIVSDWDPLGR